MEGDKDKAKISKRLLENLKEARICQNVDFHLNFFCKISFDQFILVVKNSQKKEKVLRFKFKTK